MKKMGLLEAVRAALHDAGIGGETRLGVALSGGADSVALLASLRQLGYPCTALHCNFHLRGEESDRDERHARQIAAAVGADIRITHFDVPRRCRATGESLEMACRELRYAWFAEMASELGLQAVAIGHNADDNAETLMLNLLRGSGVNGLAGIQVQNGLYIRPLLKVARQEIVEYLAEKGLTYVTDSSNASLQFTRNRLRNVVLPALREQCPQAVGGIARSLALLRSDAELLRELVRERFAQYRKGENRVRLRQLALAEGPTAATLLFHGLEEYYSLPSPFAFPTVERMVAAALAERGGLTFEGRQGLHAELRHGELTLLPSDALR